MLRACLHIKEEAFFKIPIVAEAYLTGTQKRTFSYVAPRCFLFPANAKKV